MAKEAGWLKGVLTQSQKDPNIWIKEILGDRLWSKQRDICQSIVDHERTAVPASFGVGKTFLAARIALWFLYNFPKSKVISCYDDQTEILTEERGFQLFKNLLPDEKVATLVGDTLVFEKPKEYYDMPYKGDLMGYEGRDLDFLVTPNHRCLFTEHVHQSADVLLDTLDTSFRIKRADEIFGKNVRVPKTNQWLGEDYGFTEDDYKFFGFWLGDGSLGFKKKKPKVVRLSQKVEAEEALRLINLYDGTLSVREDKRCKGLLEIRLWNTDLAEFLFEHFGHPKSTKRVPVWIKNSKKEFLEAFLRGFALADGVKSKDVHGKSILRFGTINNKPLAEDFYEIGVRAGYSVNLTIGTYDYSKYGGYSNNLLTQYKLTFSTRTRFPGTKLNKPTKNHKGWYKKAYDGNVHCVKVSSGIVLVRRNNKHVWSGNTAPTARQVRDLLWSEIRAAHANALFPLGGTALQLKIELNPEHFAIGFSTDDKNMDMFTGYHSPYQLVIFDQAAGIAPGIWDGAEGLMTSKHCRWLAISNTAISDCEFANICMPEKETRHGKWNIISINAEESPNVVAGKDLFPGLIAHDWVERKKQDWSEDDPLYKIFVKAEFVASAQMVVVPYKYLIDAYLYEGIEGETIDVGIDVAREGIDSTVFFARSGERALEMTRITGNDTMEVSGQAIVFVRMLEEKYKKKVLQIKVDTIGVGAGVYDRLAEQDYPVIAVNNQSVEPVVDRDTFSNIRAEMAWAFRRQCEAKSIGLANLSKAGYLFDNLKKDIQSQRYKITSSGRIQLLQKEAMKEILGRSPDYWDAMIMAYEDPGGGPATIESLTSQPEHIPNSGISDDEWLEILGINIDADHMSFH